MWARRSHFWLENTPCLLSPLERGGLSDCTGISQPEQSALSGDVMGAVGGALLGVMAENAGMGAAIGGEGGLTGDYLYGKPKEAEQKAEQ